MNPIDSTDPSSPWAPRPRSVSPLGIISIVVGMAGFPTLYLIARHYPRLNAGGAGIDLVLGTALLFGGGALALGIITIARARRRHQVLGFGVAGLVLGSILLVPAPIMFAMGLQGYSQPLEGKHVGAGSCEDRHLRATILGASTDQSQNETLLTVTVGLTNSGASDRIVGFDRLRLRVPQDFRMVANRSVESWQTEIQPGKTIVVDYTSNQTAASPWTGFSLHYVIDHGRRQSSYSLVCSLAGDNAPEAFLA